VLGFSQHLLCGHDGDVAMIQALMAASPRCGALAFIGAQTMANGQLVDCVLIDRRWPVSFKGEQAGRT